MYYDLNEAYWHNYHMAKYGLNKDSYSIKEIPFAPYIWKTSEAELTSKSMANGFIDDIVNNTNEIDPDDIFKAKTGLAQDRITLMLDVIQQLENTKYDSMKNIYRDIFGLQKAQTELPFPLNYDFSRTHHFRENRLKLYEEARKVLGQHSKNIAFMGKELVESLMTFKNQKQKEVLLGDDLTDNYDTKH